VAKKQKNFVQQSFTASMPLLAALAQMA